MISLVSDDRGSGEDELEIVGRLSWGIGAGFGQLYWAGASVSVTRASTAWQFAYSSS